MSPKSQKMGSVQLKQELPITQVLRFGLAKDMEINVTFGHSAVSSMSSAH